MLCALPQWMWHASLEQERDRGREGSELGVRSIHLILIRRYTAALLRNYDNKPPNARISKTHSHWKMCSNSNRATLRQTDWGFWMGAKWISVYVCRSLCYTKDWRTRVFIRIHTKHIRSRREHSFRTESICSILLLRHRLVARFNDVSNPECQPKEIWCAAPVCVWNDILNDSRNVTRVHASAAIRFAE